MSSEFRWAVVQDGEGLSDATKHIFRKKYGDGGTIHRTMLTTTDLEYLNGVLHSTKDEDVQRDVKLFIDQIEKGNVIEIWEEF